MADCSSAVSQQAAEVNLQNLKGLLDRYLALMQQGAEDNQGDARSWSALKLRMANNAATFDHFVNMTTAGSTATSEQTGQTENQATVDPASTALGQTSKGAVGTANAQVAANIAETISGLSDLVVKFGELSALLLGTNLSQTQPRSPAAASPTPGA